MKLLFDQNLSSRLIKLLEDIYLDSTHVRDHGMATADDGDLWQFAKAQALIIVSKDDDFRQRSILNGHPPKVIWLRLGNCSTSQVETLLRWKAGHVAAFSNDPQSSMLILP